MSLCNDTQNLSLARLWTLGSSLTASYLQPDAQRKHVVLRHAFLSLGLLILGHFWHVPH